LEASPRRGETVCAGRRQLLQFWPRPRGTIEKLKEWSAQSPVKLHIVEGVEATLLDLSIVSVSSSLIRWLISYGRARDAAICLGRPYELEGKVIEGHKRGQKIGVPTANLDCGDQLIPADGVYAGRCTYLGRTYSAAISIGTLRRSETTPGRSKFT